MCDESRARGRRACGVDLAAVANHVDVTVACQANRRRDAACLEPATVPLDRRRVDASVTALADPDLFPAEDPIRERYSDPSASKISRALASA